MDHVIVVDDNKVRWSGPKQAFLAQSWSSEFLGLEESHQRPKHSGKSDNGLSSGDDVGLADDVTDGVGGDIDGIWQQEERAQGAVQVVVAEFYIAMSGGGPYAGLIMAMACILTASKVLSQYWFVWWIADSIGLSQQQYMGSFLGLTLLQGLVTSVVGLTLVRTSLRAAQAVHETILSNIIAAPLWFFHQNPTGRILNRLSKDIEAMDSRIMNAVDGLLGAGTTMLASVSIVAASGVFLIAVIFPFLLVVGYCLHRFRLTAREVQRLDAVLQSPALSLVTESLKAASSVRAYRAESFLIARHRQALDGLASAKICRQSLDTWITFRAELAAASVLLVLVILTLNGIIPQVSASLALATATTFARQVYLLAWACTDLEIQLNAVERLQTYHARIRREGPEPDPSSTDGHDDNGLSCTDIVIKDASLKYKTRKTPALDKVSLTFRSGEKVGLIGRTGKYQCDETQVRVLTHRLGSGKSTLISVISRLVDIQDGKIYLAGLDTSTIEPRKLRRMVSTLPQETLIFQGTLRENIDSRRQRSDGDIWTALDACQMSSVLKAKYGENALDQELSSDGTDLSAGQRQLVCAARVVLEQPAVLLVDEASANVDFASDEALQRAWQALPSETTVIMIAHRASSLAWMDRILVMDNGRVVEDGSPADLLGRHDSYYRSSILQDGRMALHNAMQTAESHRAGK
ncbi:ABC transporter C family member 10 [Beauveria bassiana D1-5]|uniref:ABC transporter C family member 10 n=1 Tax=Beauveria bassiana D1-5 TaxID=1245745 RepID=A0A0A2VUF5_BEABA|nr:ABC transporter C family member 10 [Beauveria bassiana D1-5]